MIHTIISDLRGPEERESILGCPISEIVPLSSASGDITVSFAVRSYAGTLTIEIITDPDACPNRPALRQAVIEQFDVLMMGQSDPLTPSTERDANLTV
jgi:diacylglycerol O-acyltransferase